MAVYDKKYGDVYGGPTQAQMPPSWGSVPCSMVQGASPYPSMEAYPKEYSEYAEHEEDEPWDPKWEAEKELKNMKKKERRKKRKNDDAHGSAFALISIAVISTMLWIIPVMGMGWHKRMFTGTGFDMITIRTGMFKIDIQVDCHMMIWPFGINSEMMHKFNIEQQICIVFKKFDGVRSLHALKDLSCVDNRILGHSTCHIASTIFYFSFAIIFTFFCSAVIQIIAGLFLHYYWYTAHLKVIRNWALALYCSAPCLGMLGLGMYAGFMPDIGDLPRTWNAAMQTLTGGLGALAGTGLFEIRPVPGQDVLYMKYGWCYFMSFITCAVSVSGPVVWGAFFKKHPEEMGHELEFNKELGAIEEAIWATNDQEDEVRMGVADAQCQKTWDAQAKYAGGDDWGASGSADYYGGAAAAYPQPGYGAGAAGYGGQPYYPHSGY